MNMLVQLAANQGGGDSGKHPPAHRPH
uniref:Uncharacterized protein n=1 Tax=Anguilla anguilla TaxID=7936 RepID=A0A0E9TQC0_ANGAN